jgi:thiol:disulfide interchange protein
MDTGRISTGSSTTSHKKIIDMRRFSALASALTLGFVAVANAGGPGFLDKPKAAEAGGQFLPVDQAFEIQPLEKKDGGLLVSWRIAPGYYLYRKRLAFEVLTPEKLKLGDPVLPEGAKIEDEYFGAVEIYRGEWLKAQLPAHGKLPKQLRLKVTYQGCAEAGLCYPPQERTLTP